MEYYCECVSAPLAEKLKEKGMLMNLWKEVSQGLPFISVMEKSAFDWLDKELGNEPSTVETRYSIPSYAEVFDWFLDKGMFVNAYPERIAAAYGEYIYMFRPFVNGWIGKESDRTTWHEAAEKAIEKALELIKEE